jgi:hypothetical protein
MSSNFDSDLQAALEISAAEASATAPLLIGTQRFVSRNTIKRQDKQAFPEPSDGTIFQIGTLNQFNSELQRISREFEGPSAICGYLVCAYARLLEDYLSDVSGDLTHKNIQDMCDILTNFDQVEPELRRAFVFIQDSRRAFGLSSALSKQETAAMLSQWIANYEIGDFMSVHSRSDRTQFVRMNQWPARATASPDVCLRLSEEERFGGRLLGDDRIVYGENDSVFFIQTFRPQPTLHSPGEWLLAGGAVRASERPRILILDLNGHFAVAVACNLRPAAGGQAEPPERSLLLFNTTSTDYLSSEAVAWAYDSMFPPQ